jgi:hypothetical protein
MAWPYVISGQKVINPEQLNPKIASIISFEASAKGRAHSMERPAT